MACVATWSFGLEAVSSAASHIQSNAECLDALERAINVVEDDPDTGKFYIGRGCYPNTEGIVQLDAAVMRGSDCSFGAVAALEKYAKPISVARRVLECSSAKMLVGEGATQFAREQRFPLEDNESLLTTETKQAYEQYKVQHTLPEPTGHDTLSVLCLDSQGHIAAGVSTSGPAFKPPGRVGDSPLPGCGLYADDKAGAAAATGDGERIMQFCPSYQIVQYMRKGATPQAACERVIADMLLQTNKWFEVGLIALDTKGNAGAAGTVREWRDYRNGKVYGGFPYAVWRSGTEPTILTQSPMELTGSPST